MCTVAFDAHVRLNTPSSAVVSAHGGLAVYLSVCLYSNAQCSEDEDAAEFLEDQALLGDNSMMLDQRHMQETENNEDIVTALTGSYVREICGAGHSPPFVDDEDSANGPVVARVREVSARPAAAAGRP